MTAEDATQAGARDESEAASIFAVQVIEGPNRGQTLVFDGTRSSPALVGQSNVCDMRLSDRRASRRHASIVHEGARLRLTDLGSTNGLFVNDVRVECALLRGGESIRVGDSVLRVTRAGLAAAAPPEERDRFGRLLGKSPVMRRLYPVLDKLASSAIPVTIEGELGTGKEALAEALHQKGPRAAGPFLVFDCAVTPQRFVESTLFGDATRAGLFEEASGGTLLLDEIAELDVGLQARLLRTLEHGTIQREGTRDVRKVDVRVLATSRRDLDREVQAGRMREDLFYRLAVARVELPPLRRRTGDVAFLAEHFWRELGGVGPLPGALSARLVDDDWPGNVRELRNVLTRRLALGADADTDVLPPSAAPAPAALAMDFIDKTLAEEPVLGRARHKVVEECERRFVTKTLAAHGGNVTRAAIASGLALRYFQVLKARTSK
jgi:DNA-binding NtrC family response regulator